MRARLKTNPAKSAHLKTLLPQRPPPNPPLPALPCQRGLPTPSKPRRIPPALRRLPTKAKMSLHLN